MLNKLCNSGNDDPSGHNDDAVSRYCYVMMKDHGLDMVPYAGEATAASTAPPLSAAAANSHDGDDDHDGFDGSPSSSDNDAARRVRQRVSSDHSAAHSSADQEASDAADAVQFTVQANYTEFQQSGSLVSRYYNNQSGPDSDNQSGPDSEDYNNQSGYGSEQ